MTEEVKQSTNPFDMFKTDTKKEEEGIVLNYSDAFWIKILRAGGSNTKYTKLLAAKTKPYRRAIQMETMDEKMAQRIFKEVIAEAVVIGWGTGVYPNGNGELPSSSNSSFKGVPIKFSVENVVKVFDELPELFADIQEQANKFILFKTENKEVDMGN